MAKVERMVRVVKGFKKQMVARVARVVVRGLVRVARVNRIVSKR